MVVTEMKVLYTPEPIELLEVSLFGLEKQRSELMKVGKSILNEPNSLIFREANYGRPASHNY